MSDKDKFSEIKKLVEDLLFAAEIKDLLVRMKDVISTVGKWTRYAFARNKKRDAVSSINDDAICWCLAGSLEKASENNLLKEELKEEARKYLSKLSKEKGFTSISDLNDKSTYEEVIKFLDEAITKLN